MASSPALESLRWNLRARSAPELRHSQRHLRKVRTLHIPSIRDRVVRRAVVGNHPQGRPPPCPLLLAFQTGIGTDDAVDHYQAARTPATAASCAPTSRFFPNLNIGDALAALHHRLPAPSASSAHCPAAASRQGATAYPQPRHVKGLPVPLLANLAPDRRRPGHRRRGLRLRAPADIVICGP